MIDIIYVQSNASHPAGFTYTVTDQSNDWWLITMTHTPAYHIIDGKRIIMPAHSITLYPPILLLNTVPLKMKYSVMTGCDFIQMNHLSVMVAYLLVPLLKQWITLI